MKIIIEPMEGLKVLEPKIFGDERGYFFEEYNFNTFKELGITDSFVQDNRSMSSYGTIRGLHFQRGELAQSKLVTVILGKVIDVALDLRPWSTTYKKFFSIELSEENKYLMYIPRGFAHGFGVLSETAIFSYKCDNFYSPANESGILFNDPSLGIEWKIPQDKIIISSKDLNNPFLKDAIS
jgi:dTDP-4-dehydrorhamnose 3,5-epimerase